MSKRGVKNIVLLLLFTIYIWIQRLIISGSLNQVSILEKFIRYPEYINVAFLIIFLALAIWLLGYRKYKDCFDSKNIMRTTLVYILVTFILMYALGLAVGFNKNAYSRNIVTLFHNICTPILTIILVEFIRYVTIWANKDKKIWIILYTILLTIFEVSCNIYKVPDYNLKEIFSLCATIIIPISIKNAVMSYLCYYVGYKVPIVYRLIMDIYLFIIPIVPVTGDYIDSMILIALPSIIYINSFSHISERSKEEEYLFENEKFSFWDVPIVLLIIVLAALVSGLFPHYMIGVGSDSMSPKIKKGDAVILEKVKDPDKLKEKDIIAYYNSDRNKVIIHRITEISTADGERVFVTKGDANNAADSNVVVVSQIRGVVKVKIPYIAYPTVWISEYLSK